MQELTRNPLASPYGAILPNGGGKCRLSELAAANDILGDPQAPSRHYDRDGCLLVRNACGSAEIGAIDDQASAVTRCTCGAAGASTSPSLTIPHMPVGPIKTGTPGLSKMSASVGEVDKDIIISTSTDNLLVRAGTASSARVLLACCPADRPRRARAPGVVGQLEILPGIDKTFTTGTPPS